MRQELVRKHLSAEPVFASAQGAKSACLQGIRMEPRPAASIYERGLFWRCPWVGSLHSVCVSSASPSASSPPRERAHGAGAWRAAGDPGVRESVRGRPVHANEEALRPIPQRLAPSLAMWSAYFSWPRVCRISSALLMVGFSSSARVRDCFALALSLFFQ